MMSNLGAVWSHPDVSRVQDAQIEWQCLLGLCLSLPLHFTLLLTFVIINFAAYLAQQSQHSATYGSFYNVVLGRGIWPSMKPTGNMAFSSAYSQIMSLLLILPLSPSSMVIREVGWRGAESLQFEGNSARAYSCMKPVLRCLCLYPAWAFQHPRSGWAHQKKKDYFAYL